MLDDDGFVDEGAELVGAVVVVAALLAGAAGGHRVRVVGGAGTVVESEGDAPERLILCAVAPHGLVRELDYRAVGPDRDEWYFVFPLSDTFDAADEVRAPLAVTVFCAPQERGQGDEVCHVDLLVCQELFESPREGVDVLGLVVLARPEEVGALVEEVWG